MTPACASSRVRPEAGSLAASILPRTCADCDLLHPACPFVLYLQTKQQIKRLRRQQSNRESARRSRQRKAEEANMLARRVGEMEVTAAALQAKNTALVAEVQQLRSIIEMMANDSSALAAQVGFRQTIGMHYCGLRCVNTERRISGSVALV